MKKILVTGGAGYIGSHTCIELLEAGYEVVVVDNLSNSNTEALKRVESITGKSITFYLVDIRERDKMAAVFAEHAFSAVIHFAGLKAVNESMKNPLKYYSNNITGTINLLEVMQQFNCNKIVFSSSATVYGNPIYSPCDEKHQIFPINPYGRSKYFIEEIIKDWTLSNDKNKSVILRYFNPVGAHKSGIIGESPRGIPNNLFPFILGVISKKYKYLSIYGNDYDTLDGTGVRDYVHVEDIAMAHVNSLDLFTQLLVHDFSEVLNGILILSF